LYLTTDGYNKNDTVIFDENTSPPGKPLQQSSSEEETMALANKPSLQGESGEYVRGTTWTFEDSSKNSDQCHILWYMLIIFFYEQAMESY